ncbi:TonB-dependent receptor [Sphingomonas sp. BT553]|uniref:TonB-dependent receptor n=1 Tax=Sphingomonas mollis TaxID=2795726 RepID=A0ABS0XPK4_9SPHN|nr:TonB-dependent receptor [Sphingomonas sp. BT553]
MDRARQEATGNDDEVVVLGRRIPGSAIRDVDPIAVLGPDDIRALGATSLTELMKRLKPLSTSSGGGDPVLLLNGRRVSGFGEMQDIPPEAIERTEILPEQDAVRFGFPPTVRVMNFITRKQFRSVAVQQLGGTSTEGGGATNYAEIISTRIDGPRRTSLSASHLRQNRILQSQRDIVPDPDILFALQGNVTGTNSGSLDPRLDQIAGRPMLQAGVPTDPAVRQLLSSYDNEGLATTDLGPYRTLQPRSDTFRVDGTVAAPLDGKISGSLNLTMEAQRSLGLNGLSPALLRVPGGNPGLPFADEVLLYRYLPGTLLRQRTTNLNLHGSGTLQGDYRRWTWNVTTTYDRNRSGALTDQGISVDQLQAAIAAGGDPLMSPDAAALSRRIRNDSHTTTNTVVGEAVANGPVLRLPAGEATVTMTTDFARSTSSGRQDGMADQPLRLERTTRGASVNIDVPITSPDKDVLPFMGRLSANGTLGISGVSNYGRLVTSNYGLNWTPIRGVQFNATINDARTPPPIALLTNPVFTSLNVPFFDFTTGASALVTVLSGGNPDLSPERRRVTTLGVAWQPMRDKEFRVNLDYFDTQISDQTAYLGGATSDFQAAFPGHFLRDPSGSLIQADLRPVNIAREDERKLRVSVNLWTPIGRAPPPPSDKAVVPLKDAPPPKPPKQRPSLFVFLTTTWRLDNRLILQPGSPTLNLLDGATLTGTGGRSRWEVEGNVGGMIGAVNLGVFARLQGATRVRNDLAASDLRFSGRTWLVAYGSLDAEKVVGRPWARKMTLNLTVENLLNDRVDVRDRIGDTPNRFQSAYTDPMGRSIRLGVRKLF